MTEQQIYDTLKTLLKDDTDTASTRYNILSTDECYAIAYAMGFVRWAERVKP